MTRKDYVRIAAALKVEHDIIEDTSYRRDEKAHEWFLSGWEVTVRSIAGALASDNPRFDRERFYRAAGLTATGGRA